MDYFVCSPFVWNENKVDPIFSPQSCPSFPPRVFMGCLKLTTERRREQLKPRPWIEAAGISKGVPKCCFTPQMMFLYHEWNWIRETYSYFLHSGFASSESQLWTGHLECTPMYTYFTYSFWIYHAVFTAPLQASMQRPPQELDAMERAETWAVCAHLALLWHCSWWLELPWSPCWSLNLSSCSDRNVNESRFHSALPWMAVLLKPVSWVEHRAGIFTEKALPAW